jgi:hypothetical protein
MLTVYPRPGRSTVTTCHGADADEPWVSQPGGTDL